MKKEKYRNIISPIITEKATALKDANNQYVFKVNPLANKMEVKEAVESIFNVKVSSVKTCYYRGKLKRIGRHIGRQSNWKKAIVVLKEGQTINLFEGV